MRILCASSVLAAREAFSALGEVSVLPDRDITRDALLALRPDALIVRSKTRVDASLAEGTTLRFVATATAGTDHLDIPALESLGIAVASAPGCNANAVAEYTLTALALLADASSRPLSSLTLGIVGLGHVGSLVAQKARALGIPLLLNDPPLAEQNGPSTPYGALIPLADLLPRATALTLHTPLTDPPAPHPTRALLDASALAALPPSALLVNASRGPVADSDALLDALASGRLSNAILDVWTAEPAPHPLLPRVLHLTPHIAGYSLEGLLDGTRQTCHALCDFLSVPPSWSPALPPAPPLARDLAGIPPPSALAHVLSALCPIPADSAAWRRLMAGTPPASLPAAFSSFRQSRANRREFPARPLRLLHAPPDLPPLLAALSIPLA